MIDIQPTLTVIECDHVVLEKIYVNKDDSGWMKGQIRVKRGPAGEDFEDKRLLVVGILPGAWESGTYRMTLHYEIHAKHGEQWKIIAALPVLPEDPRTIASYLTKELPGIGPGRAGHIVRIFGEQTIAMLDRPDAEQVLITQARVPEGIAQEALAAWREKREHRDTEVFLLSAGLSHADIQRVIEHFEKERTPLKTLVYNTPYRLTEVKGIGFKKADEVALKTGRVSPDDPQRLVAAAAHTLQEEMTQRGHCWMSLSDLVQQTFRLVAQPTNKITEALANHQSFAYPTIVLDAHQRCWFGSVLRQEQEFARKIAMIQRKVIASS